MKKCIIIILSLLALAMAGCGGNSSGSAPSPQGSQGTVGVQGNVAGLATASLPRAQLPLTGDIAVIMVDESGNQVSQMVTPADGNFSLDVPVGHDYVMVFRDGGTDGKTLGILVPDAATGRTTFSVNAGSGDIVLGDIVVDSTKGKANCVNTVSLDYPDDDLADSDGDDIPDVCDNSDDEDDDGVPDSQDKFCFDETESEDTDDDGVGDNADDDDDNDGVTDIQDALPKDPSEVDDTDHDGMGDNADPDDDNDGVEDIDDALPLDPTQFAVFPASATTLAPLAGGDQATAAAVNEDGLIVGHSEPAPGAQFIAVYWSSIDGSAVALGTLAGAAVEGFSAAFDVSDTGAVVGAAVDGSGSLTAILWPSTADLPMALAPLGAGNTFSAAYGINAGGMIVGEAENNDFESRAVLWTTAAADPIDLGALAGGLTSRAYVINDNNIIAGESDDAGGKRHAVIWEPNGIDYTIVDLGILDENGSTANGISAAGAVVGETEDASGQIRAVAWIPGPPTGEYTRRGLGAADIESSANGIAGSRIVGYTRIAGVNEAAVWDLTSIPPTLTQSIPATGPDSQAYAATATGMIVGKVGAAGFVVVP